MRVSHNQAVSTIAILALITAIILISPIGPFSTTVENARVQCVVSGEIVFDQRFDRATIAPLGSITVWLGNTSAVIDGPDYHIVH